MQLGRGIWGSCGVPFNDEPLFGHKLRFPEQLPSVRPSVKHTRRITRRQRLPQFTRRFVDRLSIGTLPSTSRITPEQLRAAADGRFELVDRSGCTGVVRSGVLSFFPVPSELSSGDAGPHTVGHHPPRRFASTSYACQARPCRWGRSAQWHSASECPQCPRSQADSNT